MRARPSRSGRRDRDAAVEAAGAQQRGVEDLRPVGRAEDDHGEVGLEAVHLGEDLVERLLALVVAAAEAGARRARAADRVELVDEDDRRGGLLGLLEEVADAARADADDRLDELRRGDGEERRARLARDRAREQRLAGAGRAGEQDALGDPAAELLVALRALQEVDDLGELRLGLVDPGDVGERDLLLPALGASCAGAAERAERAHRAAAAGAAGEVDEQADQEEDGAEAEDQAREEPAALVDRLRLDHDLVVLEQLRQLVAVGEDGDLGLERLVGLGVAVLELLLELPVDRRALGRDAVDVVRADLVEERRVVRDPDRLGLARREQRDEEVVGGEQSPDDQQDPHPRRAERAASACRRRRAGAACAPGAPPASGCPPSVRCSRAGSGPVRR